MLNQRKTWHTVHFHLGLLTYYTTPNIHQDMPGHDRHLRDGLILGVIAAAATAVLIYQFFGSVRLAVVSAPTAMVVLGAGTMIPDTDIKSSIPYKRLVQGIVGVVVLAGAYWLFNNWTAYLAMVSEWFGGFLPSGTPLPAVGLLLAGLMIPIVNYGVRLGIDKATGSHRTRTHSPVYLFAAVVFLAGVLWIQLPEIELFGFQLRPIISLGIPSMLYLGALVHIGRDKIS